MCLTQKKISLHYPLRFYICSKFICHSYSLGYRFPESKQIRERKLQRKKDEDSLNRHMKTAEVTADNLSDNEERENQQLERRVFKSQKSKSIRMK